MKIAYRRMSGAIGLSPAEKGSRGLWYEKRLALFNALRERGHQIMVVNRPTQASYKAAAFKTSALRADHEILFIEFGSSNASFYGKDLEETRRIVGKHRGRIVFICDDPDLPFMWKTFPDEDWQRWTCWYNADRAKPFGGQPEQIPIVDFPFSSLMRAEEPQDCYNHNLVYVGRPNGREKAVRALIDAKIPVVIAGRREEWSWFPELAVVEAPDQPYRASFYANAMGSLVLADAKHKKMGWRTGRAFHAVMAGCPAVAEADHEALSGLAHYSTASELTLLIEEWQNPKKRRLAWRAQRDWVLSQRRLCVSAFEALGL